MFERSMSISKFTARSTRVPDSNSTSECCHSLVTHGLGCSPSKNDCVHAHTDKSRLLRGCWPVCNSMTKCKNKPEKNLTGRTESSAAVEENRRTAFTTKVSGFFSKNWSKRRQNDIVSEDCGQSYLKSNQFHSLFESMDVSFPWRQEMVNCGTKPVAVQLTSALPHNKIQRNFTSNKEHSLISDSLNKLPQDSPTVECSTLFGPKILHSTSDLTTLQQEQASDPQLRCSIERCERRLEKLHCRLIWLRNSNKIGSPSDVSSLCHSHNFKLSDGSELKRPTFSNVPIDDRGHYDLSLIEKQIEQISKRFQQLKCQLEAFSYLSWLGVVQAPPTSRVAVPGQTCPLPNPQLYAIRRPDADCRATIDEYRRLCHMSVTEGTRRVLRESTFNNWPWSDAWLIRFVRQMFVDLSLVEHFQLQLSRLDTWLCDVYRCYNRVPFHNYKHAFMVTQMAYVIIWSANLREYLDKEEQLILLIATICHDLDHPGFNNAYQINAGTELAIRYNDQCPLENHHAAMTFELLSKLHTNPFDHLDSETYSKLREGVIRCILATDMSRHNDILNQFATVVLNDLESSQCPDETTQRPMWCVDRTKLNLVMMIVIKVCDISNEARPLAVSREWIDRLLAEFFHQSDYEKLVNLPVAPFMDRNKVTKSASQCGFIRFVILPLFEALAKLLPALKSTIVQPVIAQLDYYTELQSSEEQEKSLVENKGSDEVGK